jgi:hypothetical protein
MTKPRHYDPDQYRPGRSHDEDLAHLAAGYQTGWWDDHGQPAPWPDDFFEPHSGWHPAGSEDNNPSPRNDF